jgi:hypothetical protein
MKNTKNQVGALVSAIGIEWHAAPPQVTGNPLISSGLLKIGFVRSKSLRAKMPVRLNLPPPTNHPPPGPFPMTVNPLIPRALSKIGFVRPKRRQIRISTPNPAPAPAAGRVPDDPLKP